MIINSLWKGHIVQNSVSEADMTLIHAVQLRPRAAWSSLAPILGVPASSLAQRWHRLTERGDAWIVARAVRPDEKNWAVAMIELDCLPGSFEQVQEEVSREPGVVTVEIPASGCDLLLTVGVGSFADLTALAVDRLRVMPGVAATRTHVVTRRYLEGEDWRLDALDPRQQRLLREIPWRTGTIMPDPSQPQPPASHRAIIDQLTLDGRMTAVDLAARLGRPASTVRRQLASLLASGLMRFRCDVAQTSVNWPITVSWWCEVSTESLPELVDHLRIQPRCRMAMSLAGRPNFIVTMWTRSQDELLRAQGWLEAQDDSLRVVNASVMLRTRKRMGRLLDRHGRATGELIPFMSRPG